MSIGGSRKKSKTTTYSVHDSSSVYAEQAIDASVKGGQFRDVSNVVNYTQTDFGAISAGSAVALRALDSNTSVSNNAITSNTYLADSITEKMKQQSALAIQSAQRSAQLATETAGQAMATTERNASRAIASAEKVTNDALYFYDHLTGQGFEFAEDTQEIMATSYGEALAFVDSANRSEMSRLSEQTIKYITYGIGILGSLWIITKSGAFK
jgi:hypothetical protein